MQQFRAALEIRRVELRRSLVADIDRTHRSQSKDMLKRKIADDLGLLRNVESALTRIRDSGFGECVSCGNEIETKRLEAAPWERYCVACQEQGRATVVNA